MSLVIIMICFFLSCSDSNPSSDDLFDVSFNLANLHLLVGEKAYFDNTSSVSSKSYDILWDFGDGTTAESWDAEHVFDLPGEYLIELLIQIDGLVKSHTEEITVVYEEVATVRSDILDTLFLMTDNKILVCAHRGYHENIPENSLASIMEAVENNISMVELDVRMCKDQKLILMHDAALDRTSTGSGLVEAFNYHEISQYNLLKDDGSLTLEQIPLLKDVLENSRGRIYLTLDIKDREALIPTYKLVKQYGMLSQTLFYTGHQEDQKILSLEDENVHFMPIVKNRDDFLQLVRDNIPVSVLQFNIDNTSILEGISNYSWFIFRNCYVNSNFKPTTDNYAQIDESIDIGIGIIQTDYPLEVKSFLKSKNLN